VSKSHATPATVKEKQPSAYIRNFVVPRTALLENRRMNALSLKHQGFTLLQIGRKLHADPEWVENQAKWPDGYPGGYGWRNHQNGRDALLGSNLEHSVSLDIRAQVRSARLARESMRQEALQLRLMQLGEASAALYPKVMAGDARAHEVWLRNIELQIGLEGIKPAEQHDVNVNVAGTVSVQPSFNPQFMAEMFDALKTVGAVAPDAELPVIDLPPEAAVDVTE
jgi:hypothetical protein